MIIIYLYPEASGFEQNDSIVLPPIETQALILLYLFENLKYLLQMAHFLMTLDLWHAPLHGLGISSNPSLLGNWQNSATVELLLSSNSRP